jgi:hydroxymethylbilane synthase
VEELHGNVDTRLRKLAEGELDAIVLAAAGLRRLGREGEASFAIPTATMIPAAGQGALVLQARAGEKVAAAASVGDETALRELTAERAAVVLLDATCATPIGVHATVDGERVVVEAFVGLPDGSEWIRDRVEGPVTEPALLGAEVAQRLLAIGARDLLDRAEHWTGGRV